ncbi:alpha/beta hydrolase [Sciscionella marina]|uniref:alpha/beta hydrolase n=1 Tax=Sciscionella marina TaxID=508770 RepID=UPI00037D08F8|nr:alpha/beta hydrolase [Sciscionella marina]
MTRNRLKHGAILAGILAAVSMTPAFGAEAPATDGLHWGPCPADTGPGAEQLRCSTVRVPLDYRDPGGKTIDIAVSKLASSAPEKRRGVLLMNPGGPGGSGLGMPATLAQLGMPASVRQSYDLIGFDPRGIGHSAPVRCGLRPGQPAVVPEYPLNPAEVAATAKESKAVAQQCAASTSGPELRYTTTANTVRDMDRIRAALGESKISYYGVSYGASLGAAFASANPARTDRFVLDSNPGDTTLSRDVLRRFGLGMEQRFPDFAAWAADRNTTYHLGATPAQVRDSYFTLAARLDKQPVDEVNGKLFRAFVFSKLYRNATFPELAAQWQELASGNGTAVRAAQQQNNPLDNEQSAQLAISCGDVQWPHRVSQYQHDVAEDRNRFPMFGAAAASINPCAYWPKPAEPPIRMTSTGPNLLLLQNLRDPATPYVGGRLARAKLGDRARLVSVDEGGHGAYLWRQNPCANGLATGYLVHGSFPRDDVSCAAAPENTKHRTANVQLPRWW